MRDASERTGKDEAEANHGHLRQAPAREPPPPARLTAAGARTEPACPRFAGKAGFMPRTAGNWLAHEHKNLFFNKRTTGVSLST